VRGRDAWPPFHGVRYLSHLFGMAAPLCARSVHKTCTLLTGCLESEWQDVSDPS
jgi:hypothetical protein